jgi:N-acetylglucosamine-6-phosphate deacetylase
MSHLVHLNNARLAHADQLVSGDSWLDPKAGVFVPPPNPAPATSAIDLQDRIVAPGFLDL